MHTLNVSKYLLVLHEVDANVGIDKLTINGVGVQYLMEDFKVEKVTLISNSSEWLYQSYRLL